MDEFTCSTGDAIQNPGERNYSGWTDIGVGDPPIATLSVVKCLHGMVGNPPVVNMVVNKVVNDMVNGVVNVQNAAGVGLG